MVLKNKPMQMCMSLSFCGSFLSSEMIHVKENEEIEAHHIYFIYMDFLYVVMIYIF